MDDIVSKASDQTLSGTVTAIEPLGREALLHISTECCDILVLTLKKDIRTDEESMPVSIPTAFTYSGSSNKRKILMDSENKTSQPPPLKGSLSEYGSPLRRKER